MALFENLDWSRILAGVGSGLSSAGQPGGNFSQGVMQGTGFYDQRMDRKKQEELDALTAELRRIQIEEARTANTDAANQRAARDRWLASKQGPMAPNNGRPGGMAAPGPMAEGWTPERLEVYRAFPDLAQQAMEEEYLGTGPADAPTIKDFIDGDRIIQKQWNGSEWIPVGEGGRYAPKTQQEMSIDFNGDGQPDFVMGAGAGKMTEDQAKSGVQLQLGLDADAYLDQNENALTSLVGSIAARGGTLGNYIKTDEYRQAEQQASILAEGYFRSQTGAAAPESEIDRMVRQIVPVPGDDAGTIALKRQTRKTWIAAMKLRAGQAGQVDVTPNPAPTAAPAAAPTAAPNRVKVDLEGNVIP